MVRNVKQSPVQTLSRVSRRSNPEGVQSVERALDLLEVFPRFGREIGLTAIASQAGVNKATAYRLLTTLERRGYIERAPDGRKYRLGVRLFELGAYYQSQIDVRRMALPYLTSMVEQTGEAAFLCVRDGDEALCIERVEAAHEVNIFALRVGGRQPLHCGAAPRALLSGMNDAELREYAKRTGLPALTPSTLSNLEALLQDVALTRRQGYVVSMEDVTLGIAAIGAPLRDHSGRVVAAISLSGLVRRFEPARIAELSRIVRENAQRISRQLGFREEL